MITASRNARNLTRVQLVMLGVLSACNPLIGNTDKSEFESGYQAGPGVRASNSAPISQSATLAVGRNQITPGFLRASDPESRALRYSVVNQGSKGIVTITNAATGAFTYAPTTGVVGNDTFAFKVNNGTRDSNIAEISVTISSSAFASAWLFDVLNASTIYSYLGAVLDFVGGAVKLKAADQTDDSTYGFGAMDGGSFTGGALYDSASGREYVRLGTSTPNLELDASWAPAWPDLVGHWTLNGTTGSIANGANIASTLGNIGTASNTNGGGMSYVASPLLQGINFDGVDDCITVPDFPAAQLTGDFTISVWVKPTDYSAAYPIIFKGDNDGGLVNNFELVLQPTSGLPYLVQVGGNRSTVVANSPPPIGTWSHLMVVRTGSTITHYLNSVQNGTGTAALTPIGINTSTMYIGGRADGLVYKGSIDDVAIWNTALSTQTVNTIYQHQSAKYAGAFKSRVFDAFSNGQNWALFAWTPTLPFNKPLPDAGVSESQASYTFSNASLLADLVALWHLDEQALSSGGAGKDFKDNSTYPHWGSANSLSIGKSGIINTAPVFDGSTSFVNIAGGISEICDVPAISFATWVKWTGAAISSAKALFDADILLHVLTDNSGRASFELFQPGVNWAGLCTASTRIDDGRWHHVAGTYDGQNFRIYTNGRLEATCPRPTFNTQTYSGTPTIGKYWAGGHWQGSIDEFALWKRALSSTDVLQLYRRGANRIIYQVRSCSDSACLYKDGASTPASWIGPDGTDQSYFSELHNADTYSTGSSTASGTVLPGLPSLDFTKFGASLTSALSANRYFQYRAILESDDANNLCDYGGGANTAPCSPELKVVDVGPAHYSKDSPTIVNNVGVDFFSLASFTETLGASCPAGVGYNLSKDGASWRYWTGSTWAVANGTVTQTNDAATVHSQIGSFGTQLGQGSVFFKAFLKSNGQQTCELDELRIGGQR